MQTILQNLFGTYQPVTYTTSDGAVVADGLAGVDIPYVSGVIIFCICLYCTMRIIGSLFNSK